MIFHVNLIGRKDLSGEIYRQLRQAIADGRLRSGDSLAPTRELASSLKVSRMTVTVAYDRLAAEGFVTARVGSGTRMSEHLVPSRSAERQNRAARSLHPQSVWTQSRC